MAGDWIKMRVDLDDDPAVISIAVATGIEEDHVVGKLWKLWSWANRQSRDGNALGVTENWIDRFIRCNGFAKAMVAAGWLVVDERGITIPKFDVHNGKSAKIRAISSERVKRFRNAKRNASTVTEPLPEKRRVLDPPPTYSNGSVHSEEEEEFSDALTEEELLGLWKANPGFAPIEEMTGRRMRSLAARNKSATWRANCRKAIELASSRPFCNGKGEKKWRLTVDHFLKEDTVFEIVEGKYSQCNGHAPTPDKDEIQRRISEQLALRNR